MNRCVVCKKQVLVINVLTNTVLLLCFNVVYEILIVKVLNIFQVPEIPKNVVTKEVPVKVPKKPEPPPANCCTQLTKEKLFIV